MRMSIKKSLTLLVLATNIFNGPMGFASPKEDLSDLPRVRVAKQSQPRPTKRRKKAAAPLMLIPRLEMINYLKELETRQMHALTVLHSLKRSSSVPKTYSIRWADAYDQSPTANCPETQEFFINLASKALIKTKKEFDALQTSLQPAAPLAPLSEKSASPKKSQA